MYCGIISVRNMCYDRGIFRISKAGVPVLSVGNITAGGTGKTPMVEYLLNHLLKSGKRVALISRGYKRESSGPVAIQAGSIDRGNAVMIGDEPYQMACKFPHAVVIVDANRTRAARMAVDEYRAEVIVLDDGYQHRKLARDLDIVMIDGRTSLSNMRLIPAGYLREPLCSLKRAHLIAYTGLSAGYVPETCEGMENTPTIKVSYRPKMLSRIDGRKELLFSQIAGKKVLAFCGIGNPVSFRRTLQLLGANVAEMEIFPDHYQYCDSDIRKIKSLFEHERLDFIVTTEKDAVRLDPVLVELLPRDTTLYLEIEAVITEGRETLDSMIEKVLLTAAS
jgi:tetraacyldisaccharide 4'-kinase